MVVIVKQEDIDDLKKEFNNLMEIIEKRWKNMNNVYLIQQLEKSIRIAKKIEWRRIKNKGFFHNIKR